jgi:hypothetical protein
MSNRYEDRIWVQSKTEETEYPVISKSLRVTKNHGQDRETGERGRGNPQAVEMSNDKKIGKPDSLEVKEWTTKGGKENRL